MVTDYSQIGRRKISIPIHDNAISEGILISFVMVWDGSFVFGIIDDIIRFR